MIPAIGSRRVFEDLRTSGVRVQAPPLHARVLRTDAMVSHRVGLISRRTQLGEQTQLGFTIPRSFGNAVERNRCRRRLRAAAAEALRNDPPIHSVIAVVGARRAALLSPFPELVSAFQTVFHSQDTEQ